MSRILAIDPSKNHLGAALLEDEKDWSWDVIETDPQDNLQQKLRAISRQLDSFLSYRGVTHLIIEYPQFMNSVKGRIAAQQGYTIDLGTVCGFIMGWLDVHTSDVYLYTPNQWKGQKPKKAIEAAFLREFGEEHRGTSDHAFEAVMLLKYHISK